VTPTEGSAEYEVVENENARLFDIYAEYYGRACNAIDRAMHPECDKAYPPEVSITSREARAVALRVFNDCEMERLLALEAAVRSIMPEDVDGGPWWAEVLAEHL